VDPQFPVATLVVVGVLLQVVEVDNELRRVVDLLICVLRRLVGLFLLDPLPTLLLFGLQLHPDHYY
jgi:hypothetical protein